MRGRPKKYSEQTRILLDALWLRGSSDEDISRAMTANNRPMTAKAVAGQIHPMIRDRATMPDDVKRWWLGRLKMDNVAAGGALPDDLFRLPNDVPAPARRPFFRPGDDA